MYRLLLPIVFATAALAQTPAAQQAPAQNTVPLGTVDGRVTNEQTGEGIGNASVRFVPMVVRAGVGGERAATTQSDGSFHLDNVMPGTYIVIASRDGFIPNRVSSGRPVAISVPAGQQVSGVSIQLNPAAIVTGSVLDSDGKPVGDANVAAFMARSFRGRMQLRQAGSSTADQSGTYSLPHLEPGTYYVVAEPGPRAAGTHTVARHTRKTSEPRLELVRTFYPRASNLDDATPIQVTAGQDLTGTNITLVRSASYRVRGTIDGFSDLAAHRTTVTLSLPNGINAPGLSQTVRPNNTGAFEIDGVLPGSYTLWVRGIYNNATPNPMVQQSPRMIARQDLNIGHSDIDGLALAVMQPIEITGHVALDGSQNTNLNLSRVRLALTTLEDIPGRVMVSEAVGNDGSFSFSNLEPARYALVAINAPAGTYVKSISFNKQDVTHSAIDLTEGESGQIDIVLRQGAGEVDGTIEAGQDQPSVPATVILVPETLSADGSGLLFGAGRPGNSFVIRNVPPGHYYALAVERYDPPAWQNTDFIRQMESEASSLEVDENGHAQVQLSIVGADQLQQAAARLGLSF